MSHDTGHGHSKENVTIISFKNSFWLIIIIVGLFVAALNFIQAESHGEGEEGHEAKTEHHGGAHGEQDGHKSEGAQHATEATTPATEEHATEEHKAEEGQPAEEAHH